MSESLSSAAHLHRRHAPPFRPASVAAGVDGAGGETSASPTSATTIRADGNPHRVCECSHPELALTMVGEGRRLGRRPMAGDVKQLRLGLVCYGGSSLCIYMHGITKELHRLVRASSVRAQGGSASGASEAVYQRLLDRLQAERPDGLDVRVVVDVIAGTSAGGINGIFLAKALAGNLSQDSLRELWFEKGDMNELVIGPRKLLGVPLSWKRKLPMLLLKAVRRSPLRGDDMSRWLYGALEQMDKGGAGGAAGASLMPQGSPRDLFVTITDFYGYQRLIPLARPKFVPDARHRHALKFHY